MPLLLDDDPSFESMDTASASSLFWKAVPVLLKFGDREDQLEQLTIRLLSGVTRHNHNLRILRVHISSEEDLFFLHNLEVSEEDFQQLKAEQGILVDFTNFSGKIIRLLENCISSREEEVPRFQAVLVVRPGESTFQVVETNDFMKLPHITLAFRPGNDAAIKQFLAFRLSEFRGQCGELKQELSSTQAELAATTSTLREKVEGLEQLKEQHDRSTMQEAAHMKEAAASSEQARLAEKAHMMDEFEREKQALQQKHAEQQAALSRRLEELDQDARALREAKYGLEASVSELSHKLGTTGGQNKSMEQELQQLHSRLEAMQRERSETTVSLSDSKATIRGLQEKAAAAAELAEQQAARIRDLEAAIKQWEARCTELQAAAASGEGRAKEAAAEVLKGNAIIEKLTTDLQLSREKHKRKQALVMRQEEEIQHRDRSLDGLTRELAEAKAALARSVEGAAKSAEENAELRNKMEESKQQLKGNEQMIRWLNAQVNEAQMSLPAPAALTAPITTSSYAFRPSVPAPNSVGTTPALGDAHTSGYTSRLHGAGSGTPYTSQYTGGLRASSPYSGLRTTSPGKYSSPAFAMRTASPSKPQAEGHRGGTSPSPALGAFSSVLS